MNVGPAPPSVYRVRRPSREERSYRGRRAARYQAAVRPSASSAENGGTKPVAREKGALSTRSGVERLRYEQAQQNLAVFADRSRALVSPLAQVERDRLQSEFNVESEVYQQLSGELQLARIKKNQDTPVFTVLEQVTVPNQRSSPNRSRILLLAFFAGLAAGVARILYTRYRPAV